LFSLQLTISLIGLIALNSNQNSTIQGSMDQVTSIYEENSGSMETVTTEIQNINQGMDELSTSSTELSGLSVSLKDTLERYNLSDNPVVN
jgi:methyl-accepting chemotaxis protein